MRSLFDELVSMEEFEGVFEAEIAAIGEVE